MKKFAKVSAVIAVILIVLGGTIAITAGLCGGYRAVRKMVENNELAWNFGDMNIRIWDDGSVISIGNYDTDNMKEITLEEIPAEGDIDEVKSLYVQAGGGTIRFLESEDNKISISANGDDYRIYEENGTLYIFGRTDGFDIHIRNGITVDGYNLDIYLPAGKTYENVTLEFGGGEVKLGSLKAEDMELSVGAARIKAEKLEITNTFEVELGAGQVIVEDGSFKDVNTSVGAGSIEITGRISGDLNADSAMGKAEFLLYGTEEEHNYNVDCAAGKVTLGDSSYAGLATERVIRNGADSTFNLSCAMGKLSVKFLGDDI